MYPSPSLAHVRRRAGSGRAHPADLPGSHSRFKTSEWNATLTPKAGGNMLLGLDPVLSPDLLHALAAMGHGDRLALVDANYPATRGPRLIQLPGIDMPRALQAE